MWWYDIAWEPPQLCLTELALTIFFRTTSHNFWAFERTLGFLRILIPAHAWLDHLTDRGYVSFTPLLLSPTASIHALNLKRQRFHHLKLCFEISHSAQCLKHFDMVKTLICETYQKRVNVYRGFRSPTIISCMMAATFRISTSGLFCCTHKTFRRYAGRHILQTLHRFRYCVNNLF